MNLKKTIILFIVTFVVIIISLGYVFYGKAAANKNEDGSDSGEFFGTIGYITLAIAYGRTIVKLAVNKGGVFERLAPLDTNGKIKTFYDFFMKIMNKTHPFIGAIAIISVFMHCHLTSNLFNNYLLTMVLIVMTWEGIFGLLIMIRFTPKKIKVKSYLIHSQFITGILILIFAWLGHFMIGID